MLTGAGVERKAWGAPMNKLEVLRLEGSRAPKAGLKKGWLQGGQA